MNTYPENATKLSPLTMKDLRKISLKHYGIPSLPKSRKIG